MNSFFNQLLEAVDDWEIKVSVETHEKLEILKGALEELEKEPEECRNSLRDIIKDITGKTVLKGLCPDCGRELSATSYDPYCSYCGWYDNESY